MSAMHTVIDSPLGELTLVADEGALIGVYFRHHWYKPDPAALGPRVHAGRKSVLEGTAGFEEASGQLAEYFAGVRQRFDLPAEARGDEFKRRVWGLIAAIPYGQTVTYGELAAELSGEASRSQRSAREGEIKHVTAKDVGAAVGRNPLSIVVPCHRVVGKDGKLTGYAGGLARKRFLLDLERSAAGQPATLF